MPTTVITDSRHVLFTSKSDPEGFFEQCATVIHWREKGLSAERLLGIEDSSTVSAQEVKKSYQRLALRFHPDKAPDQKIGGDAFAVLTDACVFLLYQKGNLSAEAIQNNVFHGVREPTVSPIPNFFSCFFESFFNDFFEDTEGFTEEQAQELRAMRESISAMGRADRICSELTEALAAFISYDFFCELSSSAVVSKKNELLAKINEVSCPYIEKLKALDQVNQYGDDRKDRFEHSGLVRIEIATTTVSSHAKFCLVFLKEKETFLHDPHTRLQHHWDIIFEKMSELESKAKLNANYKDAAKIARELVDTLSFARNTYIQSKRAPFESQQDFCNVCLGAIDKARPDLSHHRGWKQLLADLTVNLLIFVSTASLSMVFSGTFRFFKPETDSQKKLTALEDGLKGVIYVGPAGY